MSEDHLEEISALIDPSYNEALIAPFESYNESNNDYVCHNLDADTVMFLEHNNPDITGVEICVDSDTFLGVKDINWEVRGGAIANNTHLKYLYIEAELIEYDEDEDTECAQENAKAFDRALAKNRSITKLHILGSFIEEEDMLEIILPFFQNNCNTIRSIEIQNLDMNYAVSRLLTSAFSSCNKRALRHIGLAMNCNNESDGATRVVDEIATHENLLEMELSLRCTNDDWYVALGNLIQQPMSKLQHLDLSYANTSDKGLAVIGNAITAIGLRKLTLEHNKEVTSLGWIAFMAYLANSCLEELDLSRINICDQGVSVMMASLAEMKTMRKLSMFKNPLITPIGWSLFFSRLPESAPDLESLDNRGNEFGDYDQTINSMVVGLMGLRSLKTLQLNSHDPSIALTNNQGHLLSTILIAPRSNLEYFRFSIRHINDDMIIAIANALSNNTTLTFLDIECDFEDTTSNGWDAIANLLCNKTSINSIYKSNHTIQFITSPGYSLIPSCLRLNRNEDIDKVAVARRKIIRYYFDNGDNSIQEIVDMELSVFCLMH